MDSEMLQLFLGDFPPNKIERLLRESRDLSEPTVLRYRRNLSLLRKTDPSRIGVLMGTGDDLRLPAAVNVLADLFDILGTMKLCPLIISGGGSTNPQVLARGFTDAVGLKERATREYGISPELVIAETEAMNAAESGRLVLPILRERGITIVILASSFYHLLRQWLTLRKQFDLHHEKGITILTAITPPWWYGRELFSQWMAQTIEDERNKIDVYSGKGDCYASVAEALAVQRP